jgi:phosphoribosylformimino-5-aminoimidazole carboxamide ribotide isomerase
MAASSWRLPGRGFLMEVLPAIDLERGRARVVFWPGAGTGEGAPTDRPDRIAERFVALGAPLIHLVDFDGARAGSPVNLEAIAGVARRVAIPIQVAGGLESPDAIRLAFAAGATRAVLAMGAVEEPELIRACVAVAGDWLAVGIDPRPERLAAFPWRRSAVPSLAALLDELVAAGIARFVLAHGGAGDELERVAALARTVDAELLVAGGVRDLDGVRRVRDAGASGLILGEALLSGAIDYAAAREAAA